MSEVKKYKIYDTAAPLEHFQHNGYYIVGDYIFNYKINALEFATKNNLQVKWEFNTDAFKSLDWRTPPAIGLKEIYRMRAQQLRDKYDYLILAFSGGSDSTTILNTFLENNIKIDEIVTEWPNSLIKKAPSSDLTLDPENYIYEWHLRILPALQHLATRHPEIKITKLDGTEKLEIEDFEDTCSIVNHHAFISVKRYRSIENHIRNLYKSHKNIGLITGSDKPRIIIDRQAFSVIFADMHCWWKSSITDYVKKIEYFYWTPDLPEIVKVQAHLIYNYLQHHPELIWIFDHNRCPNRETHYKEFKLYYRCQANLIKKIIYPDWELSIFQADKADSLINSQQYALVTPDESTREFQSWYSNIKTRMAVVDKKFINCSNGKYFQFDGYKPLFSRMYPIGMLRNYHKESNVSSLYQISDLEYL